MKSTLITLALASVLLAACGSNNNNSESSDTMMTDTSMVDTAATDATGSVDTSINTGAMPTDSAGVGSTPAPQP